MSIRNNRFTLNKRNKCILGVCAGLADYLEAPVGLIRVIAVLACFAWPTLILVYFGVFWWLKSNEDGDHSDSMFRYVSRTRTAKHFRNINYKRPLYRNTRMARIAGVCAGIADYLEIRVRLVRLAFILSFFFIGPFSFFAYIACWIALDTQPSDYVGYNQQRYRDRRSRKKARRHSKNKSKLYGEYYTEEDDAYEEASAYDEEPAYQKSATAPDMTDEQEQNDSIAMSLKECSATFNAIEVRLRNAEAFMTSRRFRLHCEINRI